MQTEIRSIVAEISRKFGYRRGKGANWYKDFPELIHIIGLQRSQWGGDNYLNIAIWVKALGVRESPKYHESHIQLRLGSSSGVDFGDIEGALCAEDFWKMEATERTKIITAALERAEQVFLTRARSLDDLRHFLNDPRKPVLAVQKDLWVLLNIARAS